VMTINNMKKATDREKALATDIWQQFHAQNYDKARSLLDGALRNIGHQRFRRIEARFELFEGNEGNAAKILREILPNVWHPGSWELAISGVGYCRAREVVAEKILFFPVPKCGSTSVMNILKLIEGEEPRGEDIHQEDKKKSLINLKMQGDLQDNYFTCALVRDPAVRLVSFFHGNIMTRDQLTKHHSGLEEFYGLRTRPDLAFFIENLERYRQVFITARNHTEPLVSFLGNDLSIFSWIGGLDDLPDLVASLSARTGKYLPVLSEMASPDKPSEILELPEAITALYAADYQYYSQFF